MATLTGTAGDDSLLGTAASDVFHLEDGGADTADGRAGNDVFYMGAGLTTRDRIAGGQGHDTLVLDGDYSVGLKLGATTFEVETVTLTAGHDYAFSGLKRLTSGVVIDGHALGAGDSLAVDGQGSYRGLKAVGGEGVDSLTGGHDRDRLDGGGGDDTLVGGGGIDHLVAGTGEDWIDGGDGGDSIYLRDALSAGDHIDGGDGSDALFAPGGDSAAPSVLDGDVVGIEQLVARGGAFELHDGLAAAGSTFYVGSDVAVSASVDASAVTAFNLFMNLERSPAATLIGGGGDDTLTATRGNDLVQGWAGVDVLNGGHGADLLVGGAEADRLTGGGGADQFIYDSVGDSTATAPDVIIDLSARDLIWLLPIDADVTVDGNQAFHLVAALSGHAGELALSYDSVRDQTAVSGDVDGDGTADLVILVSGDHTGFTGFQL